MRYMNDQDKQLPRAEEVVETWNKTDLDEAPRRQGAPKMMMNVDLAKEMKDFITKLDWTAETLMQKTVTAEYGKMISRLANKLRSVRWEHKL